MQSNKTVKVLIINCEVIFGEESDKTERAAKN